MNRIGALVIVSLFLQGTFILGAENLPSESCSSSKPTETKQNMCNGQGVHHDLPIQHNSIAVKKVIQNRDKAQTKASSKVIEEALRKILPLTVEDVDRSETFKLTPDGKSTVSGVTVGFWKIKDQQLIIQNLERGLLKYSIEIKKGELFIQGASEAKSNALGPKENHHWMVNTSE